MSAILNAHNFQRSHFASPHKASSQVDLTEEEICSNFKFVRSLGSSRSAVTYLASPSRQNSAPSVLKVLNLEGLCPIQAARGLKIQTSIRHENILSCDRLSKTCISSQYMAGGSLADVLDEQGTVSAEEMASTFRQVLGSLSYMHSKNVCHGNLKPENVLLDRPEVAEAKVKVADFGLVSLISANNQLLHGSDAPAQAPELDCGSPYQAPADMYSFGVLAFTMINGYEPQGLEDVEAMEPSAATKFLSALLESDPRARLTADQALAHPFLKSE